MAHEYYDDQVSHIALGRSVNGTTPDGDECTVTPALGQLCWLCVDNDNTTASVTNRGERSLS
jgi:hypothetical protein